MFSTQVERNIFLLVCSNLNRSLVQGRLVMKAEIAAVVLRLFVFILLLTFFHFLFQEKIFELLW